SLHWPVERQHGNRRAEGSLPGRHRQFDLNIIPADNAEQAVRLDPHAQDKIAASRAICAWLTLSRQPNHGAVAHAGRNGHIQRFRAADNTRATTGWADFLVL